MRSEAPADHRHLGADVARGAVPVRRRAHDRLGLCGGLENTEGRAGEDADAGAHHQIGIACGIAGEVLPETLRRMRAICDLVIADAQALLRHVSADGEVLLRPPHPDAVAQLDFLKASRSEAAWLDVPALRRRLTLLITDGSRGSTLLAADREIHVEAFPATQIDPTGAGDCFLAGFAVGLARGLGPERAARIGAYCGARAVEQVGVPRLTPQQAADAIRSAR